jgi:hypothetical protein
MQRPVLASPTCDRLLAAPLAAGRTWRLVAAFALLTAAGCAKKGEVAPQEAMVTPSNGFIEISLDEELEELDELVGSELMVLTAKCGDLVSLEPAAMMGKLENAQIRCLEGTLQDAEKQTHKDKISRVLMADAWAKGDTHRWESIVARHLDMVDRSDPDLVYGFAVHLSKQGAQRAVETIRWADVALENRSFWTGDTHVNRVYTLYRIRTVAAQQYWEYLDEKYVTEPSEELSQEAEETRNQVKNLAREWLEYAKSSGRDTTMAMQLCISSAGNAEYCEGI